MVQKNISHMGEALSPCVDHGKVHPSLNLSQVEKLKVQNRIKKYSK